MKLPAKLPARDAEYPRLVAYLRGESSPEEGERIARDPSLAHAAALLALGLEAHGKPESLDVDAGWSELSGRLDAAPVPRARVRGRRIIWWAELLAAAALVLVFAGATYRFVAPVVAAHANERYEAPMDGSRIVRLPDGSRATLAPGARLSFRTSFFRPPRQLMLEGETRFQVRPDIAHPFEVRAQGALVVAVGTVFTVRANPWDHAVHVAVEDGVVLTWPDSVRAGTGRAVHAGESIDLVTSAH